MTLSPGDQRLHVLVLLESARTTTGKAAEARGICQRQLRRLRAARLRCSRRCRAPRHRGRRPRRPQVGLVLQLDGRPFAWFGARWPACSLLAALDDATGTVLVACFRGEEDTAGSRWLPREIAWTGRFPAADVVQALKGSWWVDVRGRLVAATPAPPDHGQLRTRKRGREAEL